MHNIATWVVAMATSTRTRREQGTIQSPLPGDIRHRLENVQETVEILYREINGQKATPFDAPPSVEPTHSKFISTSQLVSKEGTKMAVLFSKLPAPSLSECGVLCRNLEQATLQLVTTLYQMSPSQGKTLQLEAQSIILNILTEIKGLVHLFIKEGCSRKPSKLQGTGSLWEHCNAMQKLSKDNKSAATKVLLSQLHLLKDAKAELEQLQSRNGEDMMEEWGEWLGEESEEGVPDIQSRLDAATLEEKDRGWTADDMKLVNPSICLVKIAADFTKHAYHHLVLHGGVSCIEELDQVAQDVQLLSPLVDDLVSQLPAPSIHTGKVSQLALDLGKCLLQSINLVGSCQFMHRGNSSSHSNTTMETKQYCEKVNTAIAKIQESC